MTTLEQLKATCTAICNTFYPDTEVLRLALFNEGIEEYQNAVAKDPKIFKVAVKLVIGYVESSHSECGISTSVRAEAVKKAIKAWCAEYGLDYEDVVGDGFVTVEDGSNLW